MNITIKSKNIKINEKLEAAITNKMAKLDKYFSNDTNATVMISEEKEGLAKLEASIRAGSLLFRAEESSPDLYFCLDRVLDKLSSQMSRLKDKLVKRHKDVKDVFISEIPDAPKSPDPGLVRIKQLELSSMPVEEAILQMEMLGHSFFVFKDDDDEKICVVYRRTNGGYGVLRT